MKKYFVLGLTGLLFACGGAEEATNENEESDSLATTEETIEEVVEEAVLIEGEDKGDYLLYGYESIEAEGSEIDSPTMLAEAEANGSFEGKVKVEIEEVCQKAGCWITFNDGAEGSIRVFFKDHFTIPTETASGTQAILYGRTVNDTLDVDFQKHLLDDAKEAGEEVTQAEYDAITEDKIETTFECDAILVAKN